MPPINRQIVQEAAEWFVEFNTDTPDAETRKQFDSWLRASPEHVRAFLEIVPIWEDGARLPLDPNVTPEELIERARSTSNIVAMPTADLSPQQPAASAATSRFITPKFVRVLLAASLLVAVSGAALFWKYQEVRHPTYATGIGELRSFVLPDKSTVELNTHSKIRIHYSERERAVELLEGQALFQVARNTERPFIVYSGDTRARAVGTRFDVYKRAVGTVITVVEGKVAVYSDAGGLAAAASGSGAYQAAGQNHAGEVNVALDIPGSVLLVAGEQLTVDQLVAQKVEYPSLAGVTAWTQRQLVFDFTPLKDVADEFNRYNTRRLTVDAEELGDFRVSGIFSSTDPSSLIRFLREQPGVTVAELDDEIQVTRN
jgi:transmembrane sensor